MRGAVPEGAFFRRTMRTPCGKAVSHRFVTLRANGRRPAENVLFYFCSRGVSAPVSAARYWNSFL